MKKRNMFVSSALLVISATTPIPFYAEESATEPSDSSLSSPSAGTYLSPEGMVEYEAAYDEIDLGEGFSVEDAEKIRNESIGAALVTFSAEVEAALAERLIAVDRACSWRNTAVRSGLKRKLSFTAVVRAAHLKAERAIGLAFRRCTERITKARETMQAAIAMAENGFAAALAA